MPTTTEVPVRAYAHCRNPRCPGYGQEELDAVRVETGWSFFENGGDIPGIERSTSALSVRGEDGAPAPFPCPHCGGDRELSEQPRPGYPNISGFDPMGLVNGTVGAYDPSVVNTAEDERVARLEAQLAAQSARLDALLEKLGEQPAEPGA